MPVMELVRIYLQEGDVDLPKLLDELEKNQGLSGVSVFRGIAGFGTHHHLHSAHLIDLSLKLPLVIEFFEQPERVEELIVNLQQRYPLKHVLSWPVKGY